MLDEKILQKLDEYIKEHLYKEDKPRKKKASFFQEKSSNNYLGQAEPIVAYSASLNDEMPCFIPPIKLDESFSEALLRMIDEKGLKDSECYKKANVDRRLFSKIRSDSKYSPSKQTALSFAIALELNIKETNEFIKRAGYTLGNSTVDDYIVKFFIKEKNFNIDEINEALLHYDQKPLTNY